MIPYSLYIHIPFCKTKCDYCSFFSLPIDDFTVQHQCSADALSAHIVDRLIDDMHNALHRYNIDAWHSVYIGGGTPSILNHTDIYRLITTVQSYAPVSSGEITLEANPEDISLPLCKSLEQSGVNRISLGIQSLCDESLAAVNRRGNLTAIKKALSLIQKHWKGRFSADIIAGLPHESEKTCIAGLQELLSYNPEHISLYSLTIEAQTPLEKHIQALSSSVQDSAETLRDDIWLSAASFLQSNGYTQYEVSNFAKIGAESIHNLSYWNMQNYIGLGPRAVSTIISGQGQSAYANRIENTSDIAQWLFNKNNRQQTEFIPYETLRYEYIMMGLRKRTGICADDFKKRFDCSLESLLEPAFSRWQKKSLALCEGNRYALSEQGLLFLNRFLTEINI